MARGRARLAGCISRFIYIYASVSFALCADYGIPIEIKVWDSGRTPLAHMVDITNGFGLKVLAEHNFLNDNNIAFSPYGLMGILVALYEGVDGESSYQIQRGMQLPWNRNVMRIGFRDIHRTLKTYFIPEEGFLAGLALNNENVTFKESYKKILRFYGFDLDNDQIPTLMPESNDTISTSSSTEQSSSTTTTENTPTTITTKRTTTIFTPTTISTKEETTTNAEAETIDDIDPRGPSSTSMTGASNSESTNVLVTENTTVQPTTETEVTSANTASLMTSLSPTSEMTTSSEVPVLTTATVTTETTSLATQTTSSDTTNDVMDSENLSTREMTSVSASDTTLAEDSSSTMTTVGMTTQDEGSTVTEMIMTTGTTEDSSTSITSTSDTAQTDTNTASTIETLERRKRSFLEYGVFTKSPRIDDYLIYRSFDIPAEPVNTDINTNKMFLVNGLRNVQVSYMHYDTVLEHAYLPHLEASALRLPLDSDRYYLLVVLPSRGGDAELGRLLARMARESDLSDVYAVMRPRRVRAIVPSFTVKGHVTLTTDLQKLGIRDVFEPRQHDFTPMTRQPGVYVRSIEQAVSVAIRKYQPDDKKKNRYVTKRNQVYFSATYPFLYFVMDSTIHVALMAGKMVDPLNTRIL